MIYFLVLIQLLIETSLNGSHLPVQCPVAWRLTLNTFNIAESVVFEGKPHNTNIVVVQLKEVAAVWRWIRPNTHGVLIRSKYQKVFLNLAKLLFLLRSRHLLDGLHLIDSVWLDDVLALQYVFT